MLPLSQDDEEQPVEEQPKRRNNLLCKRCRNDKQACKGNLDSSPPVYDWDSGEKCQRCRLFGYECSVPETKLRAKKKCRAEQVVVAPVAQADRLEQALRSDARVVGPSGLNIPTRDPNIEMAKQCGQRPIDSWCAFDGGEAEDTQWDSETPASEDFTYTRKGAQNQARRLVVKLQNLLALRILLEQELEILSRIQIWTASDPRVETCIAAIRELIASTVTMFTGTINTAEGYVTSRKDMGNYKRAFVGDIRCLKLISNSCNPSPLPTCQPEANTSKADVFDDDFHDQQKREHIYSAAELIIKDIHRCSPTAAEEGRKTSDQTQIDNFEMASHDIGTILSEIKMENPEHHSVIFDPLAQCRNTTAVPLYLPGHLAARTGSPSVSLQLWKAVQLDHPWQLDCFGRTPVHFAAYYACVSNLEETFKHNASLVSGLRPDRFGLTPLAIAACKNDLKSFKLLLQYGARLDAQDSYGRSILDLAVAYNSDDVVGCILEWKKPLAWEEYNLQISNAREIARINGRDDLVDVLKPRPMPNPVETEVSLHALRFVPNTPIPRQEFQEIEPSLENNFPLDLFMNDHGYINEFSSDVSDGYHFTDPFVDWTMFFANPYDDLTRNQNPNG